MMMARWIDDERRVGLGRRSSDFWVSFARAGDSRPFLMYGVMLNELKWRGFVAFCYPNRTRR
jgi:hypothetical protein